MKHAHPSRACTPTLYTLVQLVDEPVFFVTMVTVLLVKEVMVNSVF